MTCEARLLQEDTVYTIGETDFTGTRQCGIVTTKSILCEGARIAICEVCMKNRKKGHGHGWHGWFDDTMSPDATYVHSRRFYEALLEAYKGEGLGEKADPGTLRRWFEKNLAEGEKEELEEELVELKKQLGDGNKPEDMPFSEFLGFVKRHVEIEKRLRLLTS
jgi:hypothetical protein